MQITIRGKRWKFKRAKIKGAYGLCDGPYVKGKTITVDSRISGKTLFDTVLHELLHASDFTLPEDYVSETSTDITDVLFRLFEIKPKDQ